MVFSNDRKLGLGGWLQESNQYAYCSALRLQKFLFFYEAFSKVANDFTDFDRLRGWVLGPVFSNVWGDYHHNRLEFNSSSRSVFLANPAAINPRRAKCASFLVSIMTETELSNLTHQFHIWKTKESRIMSGEYQVDLEESDFNQGDESLACALEQMYPESLIDTSIIMPMNDKHFVLSKNDYEKLTEKQADTLFRLSSNPKLQNPVYVEIGKGGELIVD